MLSPFQNSPQILFSLLQYFLLFLILITYLFSDSLIFLSLCLISALLFCLPLYAQICGCPHVLLFPHAPVSCVDSISHVVSLLPPSLSSVSSSIQANLILVYLPCLLHYIVLHCSTVMSGFWGRTGTGSEFGSK